MLHNLKDKMPTPATELGFHPLDLAALAQIAPQAIEYALAPFIPKAEATLFTGPGSGGKSLFVQQLLTCAAAGIPMLGHDVAPCKAIYITCEDAERELHWRQKHICDTLGVPMASLTGKLSLFSLRGRLGNELCTFDHEGRLQASETYQALVEIIIGADAKLVALDNVGHLFTGNENDRGHVTQFANLLNRLAGETGAAIILLAHPNKSGDSYSGSTAWLNAVRSQMMIDFVRDADGAVIDADARKLTLGKANYARQGTELAFRWYNHSYVLDSELPEDKLAELQATAQATRDNDIFLACLAERNRQKRAVSEKSGANFAPAIFAKMPEAKKVSKKRLSDAMDRLFRIGQIERAPLWRDTSKGRDIDGLKEVEINPQTPPPSGPQTHFPSDPKRAGINPQTHTHIYKYISGGVTSSDAPPELDKLEAAE